MPRITVGTENDAPIEIHSGSRSQLRPHSRSASGGCWGSERIRLRSCRAPADSGEARR